MQSMYSSQAISNFYLHWILQSETDVISRYLCDNNISAKVSIFILLRNVFHHTVRSRLLASLFLMFM